MSARSGCSPASVCGCGVSTKSLLSRDYQRAKRLARSFFCRARSWKGLGRKPNCALSRLPTSNLLEQLLRDPSSDARERVKLIRDLLNSRLLFEALQDKVADNAFVPHWSRLRLQVAKLFGDS